MIKPAAMPSPANPTRSSRPREWSSAGAGFFSMVLLVGNQSIETCLARVVKRLIWEAGLHGALPRLRGRFGGERFEPFWLARPPGK